MTSLGAEIGQSAFGRSDTWVGRQLMCLAVPGQLMEIIADGDVRMGKVSFGGVVPTFASNASGSMP